jgi:UDP-glucose 4-epimerase
MQNKLHLLVTGKNGERRPGDPAVLVADAALAKTQLGWQPQYADLEAIVRHVWAWEKKQTKKDTK